MNSSKTLKIAIPVIGVIAIGIFFGLTALPSDNPGSVKIESSVDFETKDTKDLSLEDPNLEDSSNVAETEVKPPELVGEIRVTKTLPVIEKLEENQILRKTIPPNYKFGNFFDNGLLIGMGWSTLENPDQIHSIVTGKRAGLIVPFAEARRFNRVFHAHSNVSRLSTTSSSPRPHASFPTLCGQLTARLAASSRD